jgi:adenylylsulfate kinase
MQQTEGPPGSAAACAGAHQRQIFKHVGHVLLDHRRQVLQQQPATIWLTGLSGAGKSTLAYEMERQLLSRSRLSFVLDGDNLRHRLNKDLGFTETDRQENTRRTAEVASLMNDAGLIVFAALISPHMADRAMARSIIGDHRFIEVHVSASLAVCESRDPKGLYNRARAGLIQRFTGVSAPYEEPLAPDLRVDTGVGGLQHSVDQLMALLAQKGLVQ